MAYLLAEWCGDRLIVPNASKLAKYTLAVQDFCTFRCLDVVVVAGERVGLAPTTCVFMNVGSAQMVVSLVDAINKYLVNFAPQYSLIKPYLPPETLVIPEDEIWDWL